MQCMPSGVVEPFEVELVVAQAILAQPAAHAVEHDTPQSPVVAFHDLIRRSLATGRQNTHMASLVLTAANGVPQEIARAESGRHHDGAGDDG